MRQFIPTLGFQGFILFHDLVRVLIQRGHFRFSKLKRHKDPRVVGRGFDVLRFDVACLGDPYIEPRSQPVAKSSLTVPDESQGRDQGILKEKMDSVQTKNHSINKRPQEN